jgi:hypothetical protein
MKIIRKGKLNRRARRAGVDWRVRVMVVGQGPAGGDGGEGGDWTDLVVQALLEGGVVPRDVLRRATQWEIYEWADTWGELGVNVKV